jgi:hypothetical protein
MPLQNRVTPYGELIAVDARGLFMGNRGGRLHGDDRSLGNRRWVSRAWICCVTAFRGRRRTVWGDGYTELFFLDEVTALAAGHRPCFECRHAEAIKFASCWAAAAGLPERARAPEMDRVLHSERLDGRNKRTVLTPIDKLPDGTMVEFGAPGGAAALLGNRLLPWTPSGYGRPRPRPRDTAVPVLTPASIVALLVRGYRPKWHQSASRGT